MAVVGGRRLARIARIARRSPSAQAPVQGQRVDLWETVLAHLNPSNLFVNIMVEFSTIEVTTSVVRALVGATPGDGRSEMGTRPVMAICQEAWLVDRGVCVERLEDLAAAAKRQLVAALATRREHPEVDLEQRPHAAAE